MSLVVRRIIAFAVIAAVVIGAAERGGAGVLLVKGSSLRENVLPPLIPMPDGTVVSANDIMARSARVNFGDEDVVVYDAGTAAASRYGDASTLSLASFGTLFGGNVMIADPRTLTFSAFTNQDMSLGDLLDQAGFMVMVDVGPAAVPASALSIGADDIHTPTPRGSTTPTRTATPTVRATSPIVPTTTPTAVAAPTRTPTNGGAATPTLPGTIPTATMTATAVATATTVSGCRGDCNNDNAVTINELVLAVNMALERVPIDRCPTLDADGNDAITIGELVVAVGNVLRGCDQENIVDR